MKLLPRRRPSLPAADVELVGVRRGERVLAWSPLVGGGVAVATMERLYVGTPRGEVIARPWMDVDRAVWDGPSATLGIWWVGTRQSTPLEIVDDARLPIVVRERVQASMLATTTVLLPSGGHVRVALRRGTDGDLSTQAIASAGVSLHDEGVAGHVAAALRELCNDAGVGPGDVRTDMGLGFGRVATHDPA